MNKKSIYVAFSNQKGGVGKSAFTTLVASSLHYAGGKNVAVFDCDYPQYSIHAMRERDKSFVTVIEPVEIWRTTISRSCWLCSLSKPERRRITFFP
jgi:cellulose biosynthesis protein BcsQ